MLSVVMKFKYIVDVSFTRLRVYFHKVPVIISTLFFFTTLCETLYAGCIKFFAETSELLMHDVFRLFCRPQNDILGVCSSGGQKYGSWRVLNCDCREDEVEISPYCCSCLPCERTGVRSGVCHAGGGLVSSSF